jgi:hypothetical protein
MDITEVEKAKAFIIVEIIDYVPNSVVNKTIIKKQQVTLRRFQLIQVKG